jgi:hydroxymethylbilane synthase
VTAAATVRLGTRGSALALWQAHTVADRLTASGTRVEIVTIRTAGDRLQQAPLGEIGGKQLFVKEIEDALLRREIDVAVHSAKDMPAVLPDGFAVAATLPREDPRDALVAASGKGLDALPSGSRVGTSSLRRRSQLLARRPDLVVEELRGNVPTRLKRVAEGRYDAVVVAAAGLRRLGLADRITELIDESVMLPAPGQGVLGIQTRGDDAATIAAVRRLHDEVASAEATAERAFLAGLGGGCLVPVGARGRVTGDRLQLEGVVAHPSGRPLVRRAAEGPLAAAVAIGHALAETALAHGAREILAEVRSDEVFP